MRVAFYVSGHGYGHATRMSEVIRELRAQRPGLSVCVRSAAPAFLFPEDVEYSPSSLEPGIAESTDALRILPAETARLLVEFFPREHDVVQQEAAWVRGKRIRFIVADIPFLAGRVAAAAGVPCAGISNFTWDWIYEPHLHADPRWPEWDRRIRDGYSGFDALLKLPFAQPSRLEPFGRIVEVPLIGRRGAAAVSNRRPRVLVGMRAAVERGVLQRAIAECPEFEFIEAGSGARFQDLAASSTVVIAKLGYSTVAECVVNGASLLYPPRQGFREDEISRVEAAAYINLAELPLGDFHAGTWAPHLRALAARPAPIQQARADGAEVCARALFADMNVE